MPPRCFSPTLFLYRSSYYFDESHNTNVRFVFHLSPQWKIGAQSGIQVVNTAYDVDTSVHRD